MIERFLILLGVTLTIVAVWGALRAWRSVKLRRLSSQSPFSSIVPPGKPAVVAFSAPYCRDCHTLQEPALARLEQNLSQRVSVKSLSALDYPDLVEQLGILTVPSTVVIDARGTVRHLNLGYASDAKLREQLAQAI
jgi:thiol-disulfide isomerase/thioredoxin